VIYQPFLFGENKACLNKSRGEAGEKVHTISMLWKVPKEFVIFEAACCSLPDTLLAVLKSTVMQANKIKSGTWSSIAAAAGRCQW
jgi:hypothetical protein